MATATQLARIPDYVSTITGYRAWQLDTCGLKSLNSVEWTPGEPLEAVCSRHPDSMESLVHSSPAEGCTCGVYAARNKEHLQWIGYLADADIYGEVALWGEVVPHELGYRAQYAYPKNFILKIHRIPFRQNHCETFLMGLTAYGIPVSLDSIGDITPLWDAEQGYYNQGIDLVLERSKKWYQGTIRIQGPAVGDRIAIKDKGIGCIAAMDMDITPQHAYFTCLNVTYRTAVKNVHYEECNNRWLVHSNDCTTVGQSWMTPITLHASR